MDKPSRPGLFSRFREGLRAGAAAEKPPRIFRYPLHAYGKLPIYKDFIFAGLTEPGAREFRGWLDKGFSRLWSAEEEYRTGVIPSHSFLFRLPESKACVAGALWGSSDEGGLRRFPFTVFVSFPVGHAAADPLAALDYLGTFERLAKGIRGNFGPGGSLASFYKTHRGAEVECAVKARDRVARETRRELAPVTLSQFAESILGAEAPRLWPRLTAALQSPAPAVRLPLGTLLPSGRQLEFWLMWLERQDPTRKTALLGFLYENGNGPGRAVFLFRDLKPEDILLFHPGRDDHAGVLDPMRELERGEPAPLEAVPEAAPQVSAEAPGTAAPVAVAAPPAGDDAAMAPVAQEEAERVLSPASAESSGSSSAGVRLSSETPFPEALAPSALEVFQEAPDGRVFAEEPGEPPAAASVEKPAVTETSADPVQVEPPADEPPAEAIGAQPSALPQTSPEAVPPETLPSGWNASISDLLRS